MVLQVDELAFFVFHFGAWVEEEDRGVVLWLWMGIECLGHGCLVGESSVCGGRLVAWRIQPYRNAGLKDLRVL